MPSESRVIQVTNVAPVATREQMKTLFSFIGKFDDLVLYPEAEPGSTSTRVCYVKFVDPEDVGVSLHLTNTVFIDRALIVVPVPDDRIPDEQTALGSNGLSLYPALPASTELSKVDEIRRTVYIANIDAAVTPEALMQYFGAHSGEVKYARMAGEEGFAVHAAFIEFTEQVSVMRALGMSGQVLGNRAITVVPANSAIVKSTSGLGTSSSREIEEALRKVNEAQPLIDAVLDSEGDRRRGSRSRSHRSRSHRSRSRSRGSRSRKSRSRSHRSRKRSSSRSPRRRSPSLKHRRSRSHDRKRSTRLSKSPTTRKSSPHKSRRDRGSRSPHRSDRERDLRKGREESSAKKESSRRRSSRSLSRSPALRGSRRDRDRNADISRERDRDRERYRTKEHGSHGDSRDQRGAKKGRDSDDRGKRNRDSERKSFSSKHSRERESEKKVLKAAQNFDEEEQEHAEDGSDYEQQPDQEVVDQSASDDNRSDADEKPASSPAEVDTYRMDMDVDSD